MALVRGEVAAQGWSAPGVVVLDAAAADDEEALHLAWRRWLHIFNTAQCLPGMLMVSATGLDGHDYDVLTVMSGADTAPTQPADQAALNNAWAEILSQVMSPLKMGLTELAHAGAPTPEVGLELADEQGRVLADAELSWSLAKVALLRPDQDDMAMTWLGAGWHVVQLDESFKLVADKPWPLAVAPLLGLELNNQE